MIGSIGVAHRAEAGVADDADDVDVDRARAGLEQLALDDLADRVLRRFEAELPHRILVEHDVHAALGVGDLLALLDREIEGHVVHRPVAVEPAAGEQLQAHRVEKSLVDAILADQHLLVASRRDQAGVAVVVGRHADVGEADRDHAGHALHLLDDRLRLGNELVAVHVLDLEDVIALVAGVDRPRVDRLAVDHGGADDEADRHRELGDDQRRAQPARAGRFRGRTVGLEHLRRLEPRQEEGRVETADDTDQQSQADRRQQDPVRAEIVEREVGIEEGRERPHQQLDQRQRKQHRDRRDQDRFGDELDDQLPARCAKHLAQRDFAGALRGAGGGEVGEVHDRHAEDQHGDDREGGDRCAGRCRGSSTPPCALPRWTSRRLTKCQSWSSPGL